ncbi:MAG: hypothetical protein V3T16_09205, partial [Gemmatimonadales bacterium]
MRTETRYSLTSATALALALCVSVTSACSNPGAGIATEGDWAFITGNTYGQRYSALDQVNADNFEQLEVAWVWDGSAFPNVNARATPIYVNGKLISVAGERRHVVATDAGTGETIWSWVEPETFRWEYSMRKNHGKGVAYANVDGRDVVYVVTPAFFLHALDAETGQPVEGFGGSVPIEGFPETGTVDLLAHLGHEYDPEKGIPLEVGY